MGTILEPMDEKQVQRRIEPRLGARALLFAAGLVVLGSESRFIGSPLVQLATGALLYYRGWILAANLAPQPVDRRLARLAWTRCAPLRVAIPLGGAFLVVGLVGLSLVKGLELGVGVALWFVVFLADALQRTLGRYADRDALLTWKPLHPVKHLFVLGLGMGPIIALLTLREGASVGRALVAGAIAAAVATPAGMLVAARARRDARR
jgi:hypothetical protein